VSGSRENGYGRSEEVETIEVISLMLGAAWASGINLYAAILVLGWMGGAGHVDLPPSLEVLSDPTVMMVAGGMYIIEFFTDKIPGVDTGWDALHTFVRIPAGALMAAGAAQGLDIGQAGELIGLLLGGGVAAASHATKAGTRVLINTSPEPFSNWGASVAEDVSVFAGLWAALNHPWLFVVLLVLFLLLAIWLLPKIWRAIKRAAHAVRRWFGGKAPPGAPDGDGLEARRQDVLKELYQDNTDAAPGGPPR
jgi:hypothetical protein